LPPVRDDSRFALVLTHVQLTTYFGGYRGKVGLIAGDPGLGKSQVAAYHRSNPATPEASDLFYIAGTHIDDEHFAAPGISRWQLFGT
jgi:predicted ATP-dependent serine protease